MRYIIVRAQAYFVSFLCTNLQKIYTTSYISKNVCLISDHIEQVQINKNFTVLSVFVSTIGTIHKVKSAFIIQQKKRPCYV